MLCLRLQQFWLQAYLNKVKMIGPPNELFSALAFTGFVMCATPFYWHLRAWNTSTCLFMAWGGLGCLMHFFNSVAWNKNTLDRVPIYREISIRVQTALSVAIPACALCITRHIYRATRAVAARPSQDELRRAALMDLVIGVGVPFVWQIVFEHIAEGRVVVLFEDFGPYPHLAAATPVHLAVLAWPVVLGAASLFYDVINICNICKHGHQLKQVAPGQDGPTLAVYYRLIALSIVDILGTVPICAYLLWFNVKALPSYAQRNALALPLDGINGMAQHATAAWRADTGVHVALELSRWMFVLSSFVFFGFFGFAAEARAGYRSVYRWLVRLVWSLRAPDASAAPPVRMVNKRRHSAMHRLVDPPTSDTQRAEPVLPLSRMLSLPMVSIDTSLSGFSARFLRAANAPRALRSLVFASAPAAPEAEAMQALLAPAPAVVRRSRQTTMPTSVAS
ncbi:pheromone A receptor-domain-containing protein [Gloeopeniophorella convolvens]|nr:pheromone A receptor-domain-containing protein [Gloeopeniophorella convolvens]